MADDERLREALLELQLLRDREAQSLAHAQTLADCLEAYSTAPDAEAALKSLLSAIGTKVEVDVTLILSEPKNNRSDVLVTSDERFLDATITAPLNLSGRSRNLANLNAVGEWDLPHPAENYVGLMSHPTANGTIVVTLRSAPRRFTKNDMQLFERLAGLVAQAMRNASLAREKDLLSAAVAGSSTGIAIADASDANLPLVYVNKAFEDISGYSSAEVIGENCRFLSAELKDSPERSRLRASVRARRSGKFLLLNQRKSGELFWNELSLFPVRDNAGEVRSLVATQTDVTERVEAGEARDQARARMEMALSATDDAFLVLEEDGRVAFSNLAISELFPAPATNWSPKTSFDENWEEYLAHAADLPGSITRLLRSASMRNLAQIGSGRELDLPDGRSVFIRAAPLEDGGLVITATDISPMKTAQNLLAQRLAAIEAAPDGIAISDPEGRLVYLNPAAAKLLGYGRASAAFGRVWRQQYQNRNALAHISHFEPIMAELDDDQGTIHEITTSPLENQGHVILVRDVTEKLATEAREDELLRSLAQLQRQEAIAQLTAGVSHDFNNYLAAINGSATLIDMEEELPKNVREHVRRISSAGAQSAKLVNRLLDMGTGRSTRGQFDLTSELRELPKLMEPMYANGVTFDIQYPDTALLLRGDAAEFNQVVLNLLLNAGEAISSDIGTVSLKAAQFTPHDLPEPNVGTLIKNRPYAVLDVVDTGHGMDAETAAKVFEPYFTTKGRQGTGLGMAMVAKQTVSSGGALLISSLPGKGTTVKLFWPVTTTDLPDEGVTPAKSFNLAGRTILVVDDDTQVSNVIAGYLESMGAEVAECEDPRDAIEAIEDDPKAWSALISDYDMPIMNGGELAQRARGASEHLPIIIVTALARRLNDPRLVDAQVAAILPKPVDLVQLSQMVSDAGQAKRD
ncbi:MAG: PAS domain-containing protein [Marinovum sp.]|nr:PAS domain-containing protein [Marinovum sp.]